MVSSIIESMSTRKLTYVVATLLTMQMLCFLIGALVSPTPNSSMQYIATKCIDKSRGQDRKVGKNQVVCTKILVTLTISFYDPLIFSGLFLAAIIVARASKSLIAKRLVKCNSLPIVLCLRSKCPILETILK